MEFIIMKLKCFVTFLLLLNTPFLYAADLRGKLSGISGSQINVNCEGALKSTTTSTAGNFHVADIAVNKACFFTVNKGKLISVKIPFSSNKSVTIYNGTLKKFGNKILVIRK